MRAPCSPTIMIETRLKIFMSDGIAVLCALIAAGNINDPGTNSLFVQHVFSIDTIQPASAMATHALPIPPLWRIGFWMIVVGEALTAILFALGAVELLRSQKFYRAGFSPCQAVCSCRGRLRIPCSVYRLSCCWWLMVCDVAVTNLEWPAARVSHPRINSSRSDLRCPTGRRTLTQGPCKAPRPHPQSQNWRAGRAVWRRSEPGRRWG